MDLLEACRDLISSAATPADGHHPDAAVGVQFNAGAWQKFMAAVAAAVTTDPPRADEPDGGSEADQSS